ncbi:GNAT family protein [Kitasatospora purpeofusca]|uniref:GNAT family N-acetyltransferase n=1 Tax=Kitasatospora purpeofusca TaxID=67352 RepID=A0ABZ1TTH0_9ACTN|nr:GNAT family protein [Kitasatospora purpeofusca]
MCIVRLSADVRRRGYATEAMTAVAGRLFDDGVRRITAACDARNTASARLLRRVGFEQQDPPSLLRPELVTERVVDLLGGAVAFPLLEVAVDRGVGREIVEAGQLGGFPGRTPSESGCSGSAVRDRAGRLIDAA